MRAYKTVGTVSIFGGYIGLTEDQAAVRAPHLKKGRNGKAYEILSRVQFKAGEVIRLEKPDKGLLKNLIEVGKTDDVG